VGPNYVLDAGRLAKTIINNITITIPSEMSAEGLDALNFEIDHEQGSFISEATLNGNKIIITTCKIYKKQHMEVEEWSNLVEMLEAAYNFTQKKIVLKPQ